jgi:hypothetical protein
MMQARADAVHDGQVMDILFAMKPDRPEFRRRIFGVSQLGTMKPKPLRVPIVRFSDVVHHAVKMVNAHNPGAAVMLKLLQIPIPLFYLRKKFDRDAAGILNSERPSFAKLVSGFDPLRRKSVLLGYRQIKITLTGDFEADKT